MKNTDLSMQFVIIGGLVMAVAGMIGLFGVLGIPSCSGRSHTGKLPNGETCHMEVSNCTREMNCLPCDGTFTINDVFLPEARFFRIFMISGNLGIQYNWIKIPDFCAIPTGKPDFLTINWEDKTCRWDFNIQPCGKDTTENKENGCGVNCWDP